MEGVNIVRRHLMLILVASLMMGIVVSPALAVDGNHTCPTPGPEFGPHIAKMAPECPLENGQMFGDMVSNMARGLPCPC